MEKYFDNSGEQKDSVQRFEEMVRKNEHYFFDLSTYEFIIQHYISKGDFDKAISACNMGIEQHPYSGDLMIEMAQLHMDGGHYKQALEAIEKAETLQPGDYELIGLKGAVLLDMERFSESIEAYLYVLPFAEEKDEAHYNLGLAYQGLGDNNEAIRHFKEALTINSANEDALFELVTCLEIEDALESSISYYEEFIDSNPYSSNGWYNLGIVHDKLGQFEKAVNAYEYATLIEPEFSSAFYNLGSTLMHMGKFIEAIEYFEKTIELESWQDALLFLNLGQCYHQLEQYDKAISYYQKALFIDDENDMACFGVGKCLDEQERWYESIHFFKKAAKLDPTSSSYWMSLAEAEYKVGNLTSSLDAYQNAADLDPKNRYVWLNWSYLVSEQGDYDRAIELALSGLDELPEDAEIYYRTVAYMILAGNYKEAFNFLENALILDYDKHVLLFEFFPELETQKALMKIIDQFKEGDVR